jgi:hypothetical protein
VLGCVVARLPFERASEPLAGSAVGDHDVLVDHRDGDEQRSQWDSLFLTVAEPNFTGFDSRRSRRGQLVVAVIAATLLAVLGVTLALSALGTTTPSTPTSPSPTVVTSP